MFKSSTVFVPLILAGLLHGCAASKPPVHDDLTALALGNTAMPAHWRHDQSPAQFDAGFLGFKLDPTQQPPRASSNSAPKRCNTTPTCA